MVSFKPKPAFLKLQADLDFNFKSTNVCEFNILYWKIWHQLLQTANK